MYPHVARKAQEELDRVTGNDRLPSFEDREKIPYIDCILKECLRYVLLPLQNLLTNFSAS